MSTTQISEAIFLLITNLSLWGVTLFKELHYLILNKRQKYDFEYGRSTKTY